MFLKNVLCIIYFGLISVFMAAAQDCSTYGQSCSDDYSCCGGCCLSGICKDTYLDCRTIDAVDPCIDRYCPEDQVCYTFVGCKGCGPVPECRTVPIPEEFKKNKTLLHYHVFNSCNALMLSFWPLSLVALGFVLR